MPIYDPARGEMTKQRDNYYPVVRAKDLFQIPDGRDNVEEGILIWVEAGEKTQDVLLTVLVVRVGQALTDGLVQNGLGVGSPTTSRTCPCPCAWSPCPAPSRR